MNAKHLLTLKGKPHSTQIKVEMRIKIIHTTTCEAMPI